MDPDWILSAVTHRIPRLPSVYSFAAWSQYIPQLLGDGEESFPLVLPSWDNTPRSVMMLSF